MNTNTKKNPIGRLPDWRVTLPLARSAPRCRAKTRIGGSCQQPAMSNGRCRMHGGASTGPRTAEGLQRIVQARTVHGAYGAEMRALRRMLRSLDEEQRRLLGLVK